MQHRGFTLANWAKMKAAGVNRLTDSDSEEEYLTLSQLTERVRGWQFPILQIPLLVSWAGASEVMAFLVDKRLVFRNYTEPQDRECLLLVDVPTDNLDLLAGLDAESVRFQDPDILIPTELPANANSTSAVSQVNVASPDTEMNPLAWGDFASLFPNLSSVDPLWTW